MDRRRFSTIAHANHAFASPIESGRALNLLRLAGLSKGVHMLDIGCGFGGWSTLADAEGARVIAVDPNSEFIQRGRTNSPGVTWVNAPYSIDLLGAGSQDVVLCIGSSQALGTMEAILNEAGRILRPGGTVLLGEGYWQRSPDPAYLAILGASAEEMQSHAENAATIARAGWNVTYSTTSTTTEWDEYEGLYRSSIVRWLEGNPADVEADAYRAHSDRWYDAYLRWGRETLGFGYYLARRSEVP